MRSLRFEAARRLILKEGEGRQAWLRGPAEAEIRVFWASRTESAGILADLVNRPRTIFAAPTETGPIERQLAGHWRFVIDPTTGPSGDYSGTNEYPVVDPLLNRATGIVGFDLEAGARI